MLQRRETKIKYALFIVCATLVCCSKRVEMEVRFEVFRGTFASWDTLFQQAAEFASQIGQDRLIGISHSCDKGDGVVTVWYWF
jgi:hypothetical protein